MTPGWLTIVAWPYLSVCFGCTAIIACDIAFNHRRQPMGVMNFVFPITALYFGPFALTLYWRRGRAGGADKPARPDERRPGWVTMAIEVSHCGSGCALGDVISEFAIFWLGLTIAGLTPRS